MNSRFERTEKTFTVTMHSIGRQDDQNGMNQDAQFRNKTN